MPGNWHAAGNFSTFFFDIELNKHQREMASGMPISQTLTAGRLLVDIYI